MPRQERRLASAAILTILALGFFSTSGTMFAVTGTTAGGASELGWSASVYVDIRAFQQYGNWQIQGETPQSVLTTIQNIRASTGASMSLIGFVKDIQVATESVGGGYTMDSYLNSVRSAAGGQIIPSLNLDIYTQDQGAGSPTSYCNPRDRTDCGPHFFYETSLSFLSLGAISSDPQRTVFLDSWDTFARNSTAYVRANAIFQNLTNEGWKHILVKQIGPGYFAPPSSAAGQGANVVNQTKSPYMVPETSMISQMPNNQVHLLYFDRQNKENPNDETSLQVFLQQLSPAQQVVALDNLAAQQADDGYIFAYPVMTYTVFLGTTYNWDANTAVQPNGQSFLKLIESLISLYDGVQTTSTTSTSSTTSQSSSTTSQSSSTSSSTTSSTSSTSSTTSQSSSTSSSTTSSTNSSSSSSTSQSSSTSRLSSSSRSTSSRTSAGSTTIGGQTYSLAIEGSCASAMGGTFPAGSIVSVTASGVCQRDNGTGFRVASWAIDGGNAHPVSTDGALALQVAMNSSHTVRFNEVPQHELSLDYGAQLAQLSLTPPTIQGDDYWYDSSEAVTYVGRILAGAVQVVGWSVDDGPLTPVGPSSSFNVAIPNMSASHVLKVAISVSSDEGCESDSCRSAAPSTVYLNTNEPSGVTITIDGVPYPAFVSFSWPTGSVHTLSAPPTIEGSASRAAFSSWTGTIHSGDPVISFTVNGTTNLSLDYRIQYKVRLSFEDAVGNGISPLEVTLHGGNSTVTLPENSTAWLSYGTKYVLSSAIWQGTEVAESGAADTFLVDSPSINVLPLMVYPQSIKVEDPYSIPLAGVNVHISTVGGVVLSAVTDANGVATLDVPLGLYYASADFLGISSTVWQGSVGSHSLTLTVDLSYPVMGTIIPLVILPILLLLRHRRNEVNVVHEVWLRRSPSRTFNQELGPNQRE